ncbi:putative respiratory burst oxidase-like protein E [Iris pallida]|uniref:Respiratory burst oxidase-like protein E n=1 Tax=Iris pallida TaxID=29817 RepID=A0AAX6GSC3_IRIPA|nr:putative respiratory burst oxidase-like protein E [Iris pallida]
MGVNIRSRLGRTRTCNEKNHQGSPSTSPVELIPVMEWTLQALPRCQSDQKPHLPGGAVTLKGIKPVT